MAKHTWVASLFAAHSALLGACHSDTDLPSDPPKSLIKVTSGGFVSPGDAVASPDGRDFYFTAYTDDADRLPAIWKTSSEPGSTASALASGDPLEAPIGLVMACDGAQLYIADMGSEVGAVFSLSTGGGSLADLGATNIVRPGGLAMGPDCKTLYATGRTDDGTPALFSLPVTGGAASIVWMGAPLASPTGLHVDDQGVAWVMDHRAFGDTGEGVLFAIPSDGSAANIVMDDLRMGTPGGVSLTAGGGTAVMPTRDHDGNAQITSVNIASGEMSQLAAPDMIDPAGLRTARKAGVFAIVDSEGGAIYRADN
jgi:DNA-binding beta-propeller fold protein YncE